MMKFLRRRFLSSVEHKLDLLYALSKEIKHAMATATAIDNLKAALAKLESADAARHQVTFNAIGQIKAELDQIRDIIESDGDTADIQAAADRATAVADGLETDTAALVQSIADAKSAPTSFAVAPATIGVTAGAQTIPLSFVNGKAPFAFLSLPAGVSFDGSNLVLDDTAQPGTYPLLVSDSSMPTPLGAGLSLVISA